MLRPLENAWSKACKRYVSPPPPPPDTPQKHLVDLYRGKLRVVPGADALVPEDAAQLVHSVEPPYDQALRRGWDDGWQDSKGDETHTRTGEMITNAEDERSGTAQVIQMHTPRDEERKLTPEVAQGITVVETNSLGDGISNSIVL